MRVSSRELFVGFLLVVGLVVVACQPAQPVLEVATPSSETVVESEPITDSVTLESAPITETEALSETGTITDSVPLTASVTTTSPATTVGAVTETVAVTTVAITTVAVTTTVSVTTTTATTSTTEVVESGPVADPALVAAGLAVYRAQYCGVCHTLTAAETRGTFGPPHDGLGTTAVERIADPAYAGKATTAAEYIHESIVDPQAYLVHGYETTSHRMPSYSFIDAPSLDALVAFLLAQ